MIKHKNKFITFVCSCFIAIGSLFCLIGAVGNTLAYTPTKFTTTDLDNAITQINSSFDFKTYFDGYFTFDGVGEFKLYGFSSLPNVSYVYYENDNGIHFDLAFNTPLSNGNPRYTANTSTLLSSIARIELLEIYSSGSYITVGATCGGLTATTNVNMVQIAMNKAIPYNSVVTVYINNNFYNFCSLYMLKQNESYLRAFDTNAYEEGYDQGLIEGADVVLENPNDYGLYTEEELNQNYDNGYINGIKFANQGFLLGSTIRVGILYNEIGLSSIQTSTSPSYITNSNNIYVLSSAFYTALNNIQNDANKSLYNVAVNISNLSFYFTEETILNVINPIGISTSTSFIVQFGTWQLGSNAYEWFSVVYNVVPVINNNQIVNYEITYNIPNELYNRRVLEIAYAFSNSSDDIPLAQINNFALYDKNVNFNNGYELGYIAGVDSVDTEQYYNEGYNQGVVVGKNVGYNEGLSNADNATFYSLISSVIDVPINALRNLFNIEVLGVNLFGFFTGLFTLCIIITLIRLFLGGK